jgi:hypothetical protein
MEEGKMERGMKGERERGKEEKRHIKRMTDGRRI